MFIKKEYDIYDEEFCKLTSYDDQYNQIILEHNKKWRTTEKTDGYCIEKYNDRIDEYNKQNKYKIILNKLVTVKNKKTKLNCIEDEIKKFALYTTNMGKIDLHVLTKINGNDKVLIWIDGLNASFLHYHVTSKLPNLDIITVDLRRCGRSKNDDTLPHYCSNFKEYFEELDMIIEEFNCAQYKEIILYGHSTGGLIVTLYANYRQKMINNKLQFRVILNSPFFEIHNPGQPYLLFILKYIIYYISKYIIYYLDRYFKLNLYLIKLVRGGTINSYVLAKNRNYYVNGLLSFARDIPLTLGFLTNVIRYQSLLRRNKIQIKYPLLVLHSDKTGENDMLTKCDCISDTVLNIEHIKKYSAIISCSDDIRIIEVKNGCHDVFLSTKEVTDKVIKVINNFVC